MFKLIHNAVDLKLIPGASSAFVDGEKDVYGLSEYPNVLLKSNAIHDVASLTKLFVSERIFQLLDRGLIKLDDPVHTHLPLFENSSITIRQCLLHRSGFAPSARGRYTMDKERLVASILSCEDLLNETDTKTDYSCINFIVLGMMIEAIDGVSLDVSLNQSIFLPLGLVDTGYCPSDVSRIVPTEDGTPKGIVHDETARKLGGVAGNAGIFSALDDLIKFTKYTLENRVNMLKQINVDSRSLGWNIFKEDTLFHTGFTGPIIMIHKDKALIILTNRVHPSRIDTGYLKVREEIMEAFIKKVQSAHV